MIRRRLAAALAVLLAAAGPLGLAACGGEADTPEARIRSTIAAIETAAEEGDLGALKEGISERYLDEYGQDKEALVAYLAFQVMRGSGRRALLNVQRIDLRSPDRAEVALAAALIDRRGEGPLDLSGLRADVWHVDLDLEREADGEWRLVWAQWWQTDPSELL